MDGPVDQLVDPPSEVDDSGQQHEFEVPRDRSALLVGQDGAAGRAFALLSEVIVLDHKPVGSGATGRRG